MDGPDEAVRKWLGPGGAGAGFLARPDPSTGRRQSGDGGCILHGSPRAMATAFLSGWLAGRARVLVDPGVFERRKMEVEALLALPEAAEAGSIWIGTGGSTGGVRFARHNRDSLMTAATAFVQRFPDVREHWTTLPLYHVSGLMPLLRAASAGGKVIFADYHDWLNGLFPEAPKEGSCLSLVPTQVARLLQVPEAVAFLRRFSLILMGGAALPTAVRGRAREERLPLAPCYGMTESAAFITVLSPEAFLDGVGGCGGALPGARVSLSGGDHRIELTSSALFQGYLAEGQFHSRAPGPWATSDAGRFDEAGSLNVVGRLDRVINTGGEKVGAERVERVVAGLEGVKEAFVFAYPHADWGEAVAVAVAAHAVHPGWQAAAAKCLTAAEQPKQWVLVDALPRTAVGKVDVQALRDRL